MNFDYTYITLFGCIVFEPMVIVTNLVFFVLCYRYFRTLSGYNHPYSRQMAWFIVLMGISSIFGATAHAVHLQLGTTFFQVIFFIMNALSLFSVYYCFRAPYTYYHLNNKPSKKYVQLAMVWIVLMLLICMVNANFLIIKIHAGISLIYSLAVHYLVYRRTGEKGSRLIITGIGVAFVSIVVHSLKLSLHEWFNYKDISHIIMIVSLMIIYRGIKLNVINLEAGQLPVAVV